MLAPIVSYRLLLTGHCPMPRSQFIFRDVPMDAWVDRYEKRHQNPINRVFHTFGIPMIAVSIPLFVIAPLVRGFWEIPIAIRGSKPGDLIFIDPATKGQPQESLCP